MKRRNNVKVRNAFFAMLGDVLAIVFAALAALISEGNREYLSYHAVVWMMLNVVVITCAFYYTGHYSVVFKFISVREVVTLSAIIAIVAGGNVLYTLISKETILTYKGILVFMVYAVAITVLLLLFRKV